MLAVNRIVVQYTKSCIVNPDRASPSPTPRSSRAATATSDPDPARGRQGEVAAGLAAELTCRTRISGGGESGRAAVWAAHASSADSLHTRTVVVDTPTATPTPTPTPPDP